MKYVQIIIGEYTVNLYVDDNDINILLEAKHRGDPIGGPYSMGQHSGHVPGGQHHLHIYSRNNQIFALNKDGTAHDKSHGVRIPNKVADYLRSNFPGWVVPDIIEGAPPLIALTFLTECVKG